MLNKEGRLHMEKRENLMNEQQRLVDEIMQRSPQNVQARADEIVLAMGICKEESQQTKVDKMIAEKLA